MNSAEFTSKIIGQIARLNNIQLNENMSEAEVLSAFEAATPQAVVNLESLNSQIEALNKTVATQASVIEGLIGEIEGKVQEKFDENVKASAANIQATLNKELTTIKAEVAGEVKAFSDLAENYKKPSGNTEEVTIEANVNDPIQKKVGKVKIGGREYVSQA